jgi:hypothetical protein
MCVNGSQFHKVLRGYKDGYNLAESVRHTNVLAALVSLFVERHAQCLGGFDTVVTVPSPTRDAPASIVDRVAALRPIRHPVLEPVIHVDHGAATPEAYRVRGTIRPGQRVLVIDDTFTTGAAIFSATWALEDAGATVVPVVLARFMNTGWAPNDQLLRWLAPIPWTDDACGRCQPARPAGQLF